MWNKNINVGAHVWIPEQYKLFESIAIFTIDILDLLMDTKETGKVAFDKIKNLTQNASIILYENIYENQLDELCKKFQEFAMDKNIPIIAIFSTIRNRYSKPFTGGFEYIIKMAAENNNYKFCPEYSIMVSNNIGARGAGISNFKANSNKYLDRAFAHNIGIKTIITPNMFFGTSAEKLEWSWPINVLTNKQKNKLFFDKIEPKFIDFMQTERPNIIFITGPPSSGKTILAHRIMKFLLNCRLFDYSTNFEKHSANSTNNFLTEAMHSLTETKHNKSFICILEAPKKQDKLFIIDTLNKFKKTEANINLLWMEMNVEKIVVEFLRHLRVQIGRHSNPVIAPFNAIKQYYENLELFEIDAVTNNMSGITHIDFPLVLKKIPELNYIF